MRAFWMLLPILLMQDAADAAKRAIEQTRARKSTSVKFDVEIRVPDSSPMKLEGKSVWVTPHILFLHYTASGGDDVKLVRVGDTVRLYHPVVEDWVSADEAGRPGAGRGVQNPDEVLSALLKVIDKATRAGKETIDGRVCDVIGLKLGGKEMESVMKGLAAPGSFEWTESECSAKLCIGSDQHLYYVEFDARLAPTDPALKGKKVDYRANVTVKAFDKEFAMDFGIPMSEETLKEIEQTKGIPAELEAEVRKRLGK
ncbi:MAG: hypothetical protein HY716_04605 [Planctomycetes bacterium]|nr:hypothetical protein [Planctomycetota bacterium]